MTTNKMTTFAEVTAVTSTGEHITVLPFSPMAFSSWKHVRTFASRAKDNGCTVTVSIYADNCGGAVKHVRF